MQVQLQMARLWAPALAVLLALAACAPRGAVDSGTDQPAPGDGSASAEAGRTSNAAAPGARSAAAPEGPAGAAIVVGGAFDLSGSGSSLDDPAAKGAALAAKEINAAGGLLGRPLELRVRDTTSGAEAITETVRALVETDAALALIGFSDTSAVLAGAPVAQAAGRPFVTIGATSPRLPEQVGDLLFLACFGDNVQAAAGAEFATERFGPSAYLMVDEEMDYTRLLAGYFEARFGELGGTLVGRASFRGEAPDLSDAIAAIRALPSEPDYYYVSAMPYNVGSAVKQLRVAGLRAPIVGGDGYDTPELVAVAGPQATDVYFTTHALMDAEAGTPEVRAFMAAYEAEYGQAPANAFAALGYDALRLLANAIGGAGAGAAGDAAGAAGAGAAIRAALEATSDFPGVTGAISYSSRDHVPRKAVTIVAVQAGELSLAETRLPASVPAP